jgi:hypothetical protein
MNTLTFSGVGTLPQADWWQHFMWEVGYKYPFLQRPYSQLGNWTSDVSNYPYKYFPYYLGSNTTAENNICYAYNATLGPVTIPFTCSTPIASLLGMIENFPTQQPTDAFHMYNFYLSIKPSSPSYSGTVALAGGMGGLGGGTPASIASLEEVCLNSCEDRRNDLADQVATSYNSTGLFLPHMVPAAPYFSYNTCPALLCNICFGK